MDVTPKERYLTDEQGNRVAVVLATDQYQQMLDRLRDLQARVEQLMAEIEDLDDIRAYDEAKSRGEIAVPIGQALERIERAQE